MVKFIMSVFDQQKVWFGTIKMTTKIMILNVVIWTCFLCTQCFFFNPMVKQVFPWILRKYNKTVWWGKEGTLPPLDLYLHMAPHGHTMAPHGHTSSAWEKTGKPVPASGKDAARTDPSPAHRHSSIYWPSTRFQKKTIWHWYDSASITQPFQH